MQSNTERSNMENTHNLITAYINSKLKTENKDYVIGAMMTNLLFALEGEHDKVIKIMEREINNRIYNFEMNLDENEKVTITTKPDFLNNTIEITGVTPEDDAVVQLADLEENTQIYVWEEANKYFDKLKKL